MFCRLCGTRNLDGYQTCSLCGIPRSQSDYEHLSKGWEACLITCPTLEIIDATHELACYEAMVYTAHDRYVAYRSAPFKQESWLDENYAAPRRTEEQEQLYQDICARVLADGWHPTFTNIGTPTNRFWRRTS